jgi:hypothetical protein
MTIEKLPQRDTRIDVLRALALLNIFIDHIPGTIFEHWTYRNFGFSDAAEAFVLISGIAAGLFYESKVRRDDWLLPWLKMWRRAGVLYASHIVTTVVTLGIFCAGAIFARQPDLLAEINIGPVIDRTPEALVGIVTLGHQLGYNNILPLYAVLLLASPLVHAMLRVNLWLTVAASGLLWLAAGVWLVAPPNYPAAGYWFLNPLSWQFLFVIGMAAAVHVRRRGAIPVNTWLIRAATTYLVVSYLWIHTPFWGHATWFGLPPVLGGFDKTFLSLSRLTHILSIAYLIVAIPVISNITRRGSGNPLAILGKRSLPIFIAGTIAAMTAQVLRIVFPGGVEFDGLLIATGIAIQFALAYYLEWLAARKAEGPRGVRTSVGRVAVGLQS